jgi:hypothetical protein
MRAKVMWVLGVAILGAAGTLATPSGYACGRLHEHYGALVRYGRDRRATTIVSSRDCADEHPPGNNLWLSMQKTKRASDLYVQSNVWTPGGFVRVAHASRPQPDHGDGRYDYRVRSRRPLAARRTRNRRTGHVDPAMADVHLIRNEGCVEARSNHRPAHSGRASRAHRRTRTTEPELPALRPNAMISVNRPSARSGHRVRAAGRHGCGAGSHGCADRNHRGPAGRALRESDRSASVHRR